MIDEKEKMPAVPLQTVGAEREDAEPGESAAAPTFRGLPIEWVEVPTTKTIVCTKNAFGEDDTEDRNSTRHLIRYNGKEFTRAEFMSNIFQDKYRCCPYKVKFQTDDIYRLGGNQRAKLQYHILAQRFPLVQVDEQDKADLEQFCAAHKAETAQRWLNRMRWENGLEKLVTFGVALEVRNPKGYQTAPWCYSARLGEQSAAYQGVSMTWEEWAAPIMVLLDSRRERLRESPPEERPQLAEDTYNAALMMLSYQKEKYMTLPGGEYNRLKSWVYEYLHDGKAPFPLSGRIPNADYHFTIDFQTDIQIVEAPDLRKGMGQYNQSHNAAHNKAMGRKQTVERFEQLEGDEWTTQEIHAQGFSRKTLDKFVKHGLIERVKQGHYKRKSV